MRRPHRILIFFLAALLGLAAYGVVASLRRPGPGDAPPGGKQLDRLRQRVERERAEADRAVSAYRPRAVGRLDDLATSAAPVLRQLPGVASVRSPVAPASPTGRLVHLLDLHFVPRVLYAADLRHALGRELSDGEVDAYHRELLLKVELIQLEQAALLRCLARHHGLKRISQEGLAPGDLADYRERIDDAREARRDLARLRDGLAEVSKSPKAAALERELDELEQQHRLELLQLGSP